MCKLVHTTQNMKVTGWHTPAHASNAKRGMSVLQKEPATDLVHTS